MNLVNRYGARAAPALIFAIGLVSSPHSLAQGTDDQWEISSRMEMPGMAISVPAQVVKICVGKNPKEDEFIPKQRDCKIVDSKRTSNKYTYKMVCGGNDPSTMEGDVTFGTGASEGRMRMTMTKTNQSMQMTYSGQRVGSCTAPK